MIHLLGWSNILSMIYNFVSWVRFLCVHKSPCYEKYIFSATYTIVGFVIHSFFSFLIIFNYIAFFIHTLDVIQYITYITIQLIILESRPNYKFTKNAQSRPILQELKFWRLAQWGSDTQHPLSMLDIIMHLVDIEAWSILITFK